MSYAPEISEFLALKIAWRPHGDSVPNGETSLSINLLTGGDGMNLYH